MAHHPHHEQASPPQLEQFTPEDQRMVLNITEHLQQLQPEGEDQIYIARTLRQWQELDSDDLHKDSLVSFVAGAEFVSAASTADLRNGAMDMMQATGKLSDEQFQDFTGLARTIVHNLDTNQATPQEVSEHVEGQLRAYRNSKFDEFDPSAAGDDMELAATALVVGAVRGDHELSEQWRSRLEHLIQARTLIPAAEQTPVTPAESQSVPASTPESAFTASIVDRFPAAAPLAAAALQELKQVEPDTMKSLTLQMPVNYEKADYDAMGTDAERKLAELTADGMSAVGEELKDTVSGALLEGLYRLTDAQLVRDDRIVESRSKRTMVMYKGTFEGREVYFAEFRSVADPENAMPARTSVRLMGPESAAEELDKLTASDYRLLGSVLGRKTFEVGQFARKHNIGKNNLAQTVAMLKDVLQQD